jgi:uncharacterized membrane protein YccC
MTAAAFRRRTTVADEGSTSRRALVYSATLTLACLASYLLTTRVLDTLDAVSKADDLLGGMWATVATVFVYRVGYRESLAAALSRVWATLLSFALCLAYLAAFPFTPVGLAVLVGLGALLLISVGREGDVVTYGITTAVVLVVAALNPVDAWKQPILRLGDTVAGIAVGLVAVWLTRQRNCPVRPTQPRSDRP